MANDAYIRLMPSFPSSRWGESRKHMLSRFDKRPEVARNIAKIESLDIFGCASPKEPTTDERMIRLSDIITKESGAKQWQEDLEVPLSFFTDRVITSMNRAIENADDQAVYNWTSFDGPQWEQYFSPILFSLPDMFPPLNAVGDYHVGFVGHLYKPQPRRKDTYSIEEIVYKLSVLHFAAGKAEYAASTLVEAASSDFADMLLGETMLLRLIGPTFVRLVRSVKVKPEDRAALEYVTGVDRISSFVAQLESEISI